MIRLVIGVCVMLGVVMAWKLAHLPSFSLPGHYVLGVGLALVCVSRMRK